MNEKKVTINEMITWLISFCGKSLCPVTQHVFPFICLFLHPIVSILHFQNYNRFILAFQCKHPFLFCE